MAGLLRRGPNTLSRKRSASRRASSDIPTTPPADWDPSNNVRSRVSEASDEAKTERSGRGGRRRSDSEESEAVIRLTRRVGTDTLALVPEA